MKCFLFSCVGRQKELLVAGAALKAHRQIKLWPLLFQLGQCFLLPRLCYSALLNKINHFVFFLMRRMRMENRTSFKLSLNTKTDTSQANLCVSFLFSIQPALPPSTFPYTSSLPTALPEVHVALAVLRVSVPPIQLLTSDPHAFTSESGVSGLHHHAWTPVFIPTSFSVTLRLSCCRGNQTNITWFNKCSCLWFWDSQVHTGPGWSAPVLWCHPGGGRAVMSYQVAASPPCG